MKKSPKLGRPKSEARDRLTALVLPETLKAITRLARARDVSLGRIVDALLPQQPNREANP